MCPDCDRPASWCEYHHILFWARDTGRTDLADAILLCRHHHLLLHTKGSEIRRDNTDYWLIPPPTIDQRSTGSVHLDGALVLVLKIVVRFPVVQFVIV